MFEKNNGSKKFFLYVSVLVVGIFLIFVSLSNFKIYGYKKYIIYFDGSVSGLQLGSVVHYHGVPIGKVYDISIKLPKADKIKVIIQVLKNVPIEVSSVAKLGMQGLTGYSIIEISSKNNSDKVEFLTGYLPEIKSEESMMEKITFSIPSILTRLDRFINLMTQLLEQNKNNVNQISDNFLKISNRLLHSLNKIDNFLMQAEKSAINIKQASEEFYQTTKLIKQIIGFSSPQLLKFSIEGIDNLLEMLENFKLSSKQIKKIVDAIPNGLLGKLIGDLDD